MTGRLIALEGIDGSGKTTVWEQLKDRYADEPVTFTREPTDGTWYGDAVLRSILDDDADPLAELFLFVADHAAHLEETIRPALSRGEVVITDRYVGSRIAYQGTTLADRFGSQSAAVEFVKSVHEPWTTYPDTTVYLDVSPDTGAERSGETNKMENRQHLERVATAYGGLRDAERYVSVDAEQPPDVVFEDVAAIVDAAVDEAQEGV